MADEADKTDIDDELELTEEDQVEDAPEGDEPEGDEPEGSTEDDEDEEILTFGDDLTEEKQSDSDLIKHLRSELREARKKAAEGAKSVEPQQKIEVGEKPTLADCDYDEEKYEAELDQWRERKAAAEAQETQATESQRKAAEEWQGELKRYKDDLNSLGYADASDAEETVTAALNEVQQAVLVKAADRPGRVLYALAKHPERLAELAKISDPLKLAAAVARLEGQLKMVKKRKAPDPDEPERGGGAAVAAGSVKKQLEKLEKEAARTGNRTDLIRFKKKHGIG